MVRRHYYVTGLKVEQQSDDDVRVPESSVHVQLVTAEAVRQPNPFDGHRRNSPPPITDAERANVHYGDVRRSEPVLGGGVSKCRHRRDVVARTARRRTAQSAVAVHNNIIVWDYTQHESRRILYFIV